MSSVCDSDLLGRRHLEGAVLLRGGKSQEWARVWSMDQIGALSMPVFRWGEIED